MNCTENENANNLQYYCENKIIILILNRTKNAGFYQILTSSNEHLFPNKNQQTNKTDVHYLSASGADIVVL